MNLVGCRSSGCLTESLAFQGNLGDKFWLLKTSHPKYLAVDNVQSVCWLSTGITVTVLRVKLVL